MNKKREDTPERIARRKYEEKNKEERRKASSNFQTKIPADDYRKICEFLDMHNIKKIELIYAGYYFLMEQEEQKKTIK